MVTPCHDAEVLPYAAYLRVYEPLSAFPDAQRRRWTAYVASPDRPRRLGALAAEQAGALQRLVALPPVAAPECESGDAYVRWFDGTTYICPWQTRLRSWLALARLRATAPSLARAAFPAGRADAAVAEFARWHCQEPAPRVYIQASTWLIPFSWFVPFAANERWLVLGDASDGGDRGQRTAAGTRTLVYATAMARARQRAKWALGVLRRAAARPANRCLAEGVPPLASALGDIEAWLEEFHPESLVELDYGGLVHLLTDGALCADQSVAEVGAAVGALANGETEFATAMYRRFACRWRALEARERAT